MKKKEKVLVTIYRANDGSYWCHTEEDVFGCGLNSVGMSVEESKADLMDCMKEARQDYMEKGGTPYEVSFRYQYDMQSFFDYFSFLNVTEVARRAGINPTLLRQYTCGKKRAGESIYSRLADCMNNITSELQASSLRAHD